MQNVICVSSFLYNNIISAAFCYILFECKIIILITCVTKQRSRKLLSGTNLYVFNFIPNMIAIEYYALFLLKASEMRKKNSKYKEMCADV